MLYSIWEYLSEKWDGEQHTIHCEINSLYKSTYLSCPGALLRVHCHGKYFIELL